jgi:hypothetical protein
VLCTYACSRNTLLQLLLLLLLVHSAVYTLVLPKLALIANVAAGYAGPGANLVATGAGTIGSCSKSPAPTISATTTIVAPGDGLCNTNGNVAPGAYNLTQTAVATPADLTLKGWSCNDIRQGIVGTFAGFDNGSNPPRVTLGLGDEVTCVADYTP